MLHQAQHGKKIPVHKGAERSWCYVTDTVRATRLALEKSEGGIYNVGRDDDAVPMLKVAKIACELTGAVPKHLIEMVPPPQMQTVVKRLATDRVRALGWEPEVELEEGMQRTLEWVKTLDESGAIAA
jgi:nucleoside-diphosphate-sugar epimerase